MDIGLLYSGGKDSTLAGLLLDRFGSVTCLCCTFGVTDDYEHAQAAARGVDFKTQRVALDESVAREAAEQIVEDGYPRNGIQAVHEHALETVAALDYDGVADGTRRDDRVPTVERPLAQSIEDRHDVSYLAPLAGIGRGAIDAMVEATLSVERGPSGEVPKGDYESEIRALIRREHGQATVEECFPAHTQSRVTGRR
jgi:predicted subunit of tRNA(5-methylaminomethyl-2-thiouridylate) methyltransferase